MDIALAADGDLDFSNRELHLVDGDDAIVQHCAFRLRFVRGEFFLNDEIGTPYFDTILVKNPDLVAVRVILRQVMLETPGVKSVDTLVLALDRATRRATVSARMTKDDGLPLDYSRSFVIP